MKPNQDPFNPSREQAIRTGALLDITAADIGMPSALSPKLWRAVADDSPCCPGDPRLMSLCWCVFLFLTTEAFDREDRGPHHRIIWFEANILDRRVPIKAIAHPGDAFEPVMTLLCADEPDPFFKSPAAIPARSRL
jgi:hypothetical protein